jgi:lipopolysaccharide/colanic/teichoic acid biosynthesis glycosyltransferase
MDMMPLPADDDRKAVTPTSPLSPSASVRQVVAHSTYRRAAHLSNEPPEFAAPTGPERLTRAINIILAATALILLLPVMILVAIAVKLTSRGPIFYSQIRVGVDRRAFADDRRYRDDRRAASQRYLDIPARLEQRLMLDRRSRRALAMRGRRTKDVGGHVYRIYKFRSMCVDAERNCGAVWATKNDSRITPIGRVLRQLRLDELPQLINVLQGDMNIVGPRPERPSIFCRLREQIPDYILRQRTPPGITGWAQVKQTYDCCLDDVKRKVSLDLEYLKRRTVWQDIKIMAMTIPVIIFRRGAM